MWTKEEIKYLIDNYSKMSNNDIGLKLNKSKKSIDSKAIKLGLKKDNDYVSNINKKRVLDRWGDNIWTKEDIDFLVTNLGNLSNSEISKKLKKTTASISSRIGLLGLKRISKYNDEFIEKERLKYITKRELNLMDPNLYAWLYKKKKMSDFSKDMLSISYSTPQLILKYILVNLLGDNMRYNDRSVIKPYEIDIYYPVYKLGFEYDGMFYHKDEDDKFKHKLCKDLGILLITIDELKLVKKNFINYVMNIKEQLIDNLEILNSYLRLNIDKNDILSIPIDNKEVFKGLFDINKFRTICNEYDDYSKFIKERKSIYNKLYYLGLLEDFTSHMKVYNTKTNEGLKFILEKREFYKKGDQILIEYWYNSMITPCVIIDIVGRKFKVSHDVEGSEIKNAPDEVVKSSDIIDKLKK